MRRPARSAASFLPATTDVPALQEAAASCTGCDLYKQATQTVFGEGSAHAKLLFIGEQPGDQEDRAGHPFVGPAGKILDKALVEAGIARRRRRMSRMPSNTSNGNRKANAASTKNPQPPRSPLAGPGWKQKYRIVKPRVVLCLGVTAAQSVFHKAIRLNELRGKSWRTDVAPNVFVTVHPSAILRHPKQRYVKRNTDDSSKTCNASRGFSKPNRLKNTMRPKPDRPEHLLIIDMITIHVRRRRHILPSQ